MQGTLITEYICVIMIGFSIVPLNLLGSTYKGSNNSLLLSFTIFLVSKSNGSHDAGSK